MSESNGVVVASLYQFPKCECPCLSVCLSGKCVEGDSVPISVALCRETTNEVVCSSLPAAFVQHLYGKMNA